MEEEPHSLWVILKGRYEQQKVILLPEANHEWTQILKDQVRRLGGGGVEWEPIKIHHENSAYVLNLSQHASLLTRSRPHSYRQAIGPRNQVRKPKT
jgi:hypothetical protein